VDHHARGGICEAAPDDDFPGFGAVELDPAQQDAGLEVVALGALPQPEYARVQVQGATFGQDGAGVGAAEVEDGKATALVGDGREFLTQGGLDSVREV